MRRPEPEQPSGPGWLLLLTVMVLAATLLSTSAVYGDERSDASARLEALSLEISELQQQLLEARGSLGKEREAVKRLDLEMQEVGRALEINGQRLQEQETRVTAVREERDQYLKTLSHRQQALASQLLAAWRLGRHSRLQLVLNQDDPARLSRLLAYHEYFSLARAEQINELQTTLTELDLLQQSLDVELGRLTEIQTVQEEQRKQLQRQRNQRRELIAALEQNVAGDQSRLEQLVRDREDLETLLERLGDALADIPADLGARLHPGSRKGQLDMPVRGPVRAAFGQNRGAGLSWQGWLIGASVGERIKAVAYGRIAYADWLRGYGLLIIIDHGDGFMSLYGHCESLLAEVGDWVEPGAAIATVGTGPEGRSGVYFELRNDGRAVDPALWIRR